MEIRGCSKYCTNINEYFINLSNHSVQRLKTTIQKISTISVSVTQINFVHLWENIYSRNTQTIMFLAPSGCQILQAASTPTTVTLFLEEVAGATGWEVEYTNTNTNKKAVFKIPEDNINNDLYVAV